MDRTLSSHMQKGFIEGIIGWVFGPSFPYREEIVDAKEKFMRDTDGFGGAMNSGLLGEWMLHDMRFSSGRTALQELVHLHGADMEPEESRDIDAMIAARYGLYEVVAIKRGKGLRLRRFGDDGSEVIEVRERAMTYQASKGAIVPVRIFQAADGAYEIMGANSMLVSRVQAEELLAGHPEGLDPRKLLIWFSLRTETAAEMLVAHLPARDESGDDAPMEALMDRLDDALDQAHVGGGIDAELFVDWCAQIVDGGELMPMHAVLGMSDPDATPQQLEKLIAAAQTLYNATPSARLGGKSPREKRAESSSPPNYKSQLSEIGTRGIAEKAHSAMKAMKKHDFATACTLYEAVFSELLVGPRVVPDPWRLYANFGVSLASTGEWEAAEVLFAQAVALNPNYPFALDMAAEMERRRKVKKLRRDRAHAAEWLNRSLSQKYMDFLVWTGIDFSTEDVAEAKRTTLGKVSDVWGSRDDR